MNDNIEMLNETSTSNSMTIQLQDAQITHLMTGRYPPFAEDSPNYTMADSEDEEYVLSPEGKDQVGGDREQSTHHREVQRSSTMSPNDPEYDDAEGWCKTAMNYTKGRITELIGDFD
uniref:Uncharacterized protein n=1 Tax=Solanum tuberosum TaxID=4113 RepID=M1DCL9_SOLTU